MNGMVRSSSFGQRLSFALLALLVALVLAATVRAQGAGLLEGRVVNGTASGSQVGAGIVVTVRVFQGDVEVETLETMTGAEGSFRFEGVDTDPGLQYWPGAVYLGVSYSAAEPYQFDGDQTTLEPTVMVYETTDDDGAVKLDSVHIIAESFDQVLRISEIHLFGNSGDRTYVGGGQDRDEGATVYIPLPQEAVGLAFGEEAADERFIQVEGALLDTEAVPPGVETSLVFFSYHLMVAGTEVPLERSFAYAVDNLNVLVAQPGLTLRSDQLQSRELEFFQGQQYEFYTTQGLAAGAVLGMELLPLAEAAPGESAGGMPPAGSQGMAGASTRGNQGLLLWIGLGLVGVAVVGAVVYPLVTRRAVSGAAPGPGLATDPESRRLLADLADLEDAFEAGQVDKAAYERRRAKLYESLKSLRS